MRRSIIYAGIAAGVLTLFTTGSVVAAHQRASKIESFKTRLADLTFCKTAYEILASKPHYQARFARDPGVKNQLLRSSDLMNSKKEHLDLLISQTLDQAYKLPLDSSELASLVDEIVWDAESDAVKEAVMIEEPILFLDHVNDRCGQYIS
jgi:hypothetical protein